MKLSMETPMKKKLLAKSGKEISYDKLIIATGSSPNTPKIPGVDLKDVFTVPKEADYLKLLHEKVKGAKDVVIIGGGFIGVEVADEIKKSGKNVTLVEIMDSLLPVSFDPDFGELARKELESDNVKVLTGRKVTEILGTEKWRE